MDEYNCTNDAPAEEKNNNRQKRMIRDVRARGGLKGEEDGAKRMVNDGAPAEIENNNKQKRMKRDDRARRRWARKGGVGWGKEDGATSGYKVGEEGGSGEGGKEGGGGGGCNKRVPNLIFS